MSDLIITELAVRGTSAQGNPTSFKYDIGADAKNVFYTDKGKEIDLQSKLQSLDNHLNIDDNTGRAYGKNAHAEGYNTTAVGDYSHAEGWSSHAYGKGAHVEGYGSVADGYNVHVEGAYNQTSNISGVVHVEGTYNNVGVEKWYSHSANIDFSPNWASWQKIGDGTEVLAIFEDVEYKYRLDGTLFKNSFDNSLINFQWGAIKGTMFAQQGVQYADSVIQIVPYGDEYRMYFYTIEEVDPSIAYFDYFQIKKVQIKSLNLKIGSHVQGKYSCIDKDSYTHVVGNGESLLQRSNAHTLDWDGNAEFAGDVIAGGCGGSEPVSLLQIANANKKPLVIYEKDMDNYLTSFTMGDKVLEAILAGRQIFVQLIDIKNSGTRALYSPVITYHLPINGNSRLELYYLKNNSDGITNLVEAIGYIPMILSKAYMDSPLV